MEKNNTKKTVVPLLSLKYPPPEYEHIPTGIMHNFLAETFSCQDRLCADLKKFLGPHVSLFFPS